MRVGTRQHRGLLIELPTPADAARHRINQVGQLDTLYVRGRQPACRQLGNKRFYATFSYLGNVGQAPGAPRRVIGYRGRVYQYETLKTLQLLSHDLEGEIATERESNQREARGRLGEQLLRHRSQRIMVAEGKRAALVVGLERSDLRSV